MSSDNRSTSVPSGVDFNLREIYANLSYPEVSPRSKEEINLYLLQCLLQYGLSPHPHLKGQIIALMWAINDKMTMAQAHDFFTQVFSKAGAK